MPPEIRRLADAFLSNPEEIAVARPATTSTSVEQYVVVVQQEDKRKALRQLLRHEDVRNALIFCNRKRDVGILYRSLDKHGFSAGQLHGDMVQSVRTETLERFKRGDVRLLVCSDVAARGIDIHDLSHVFNFDVPSHAEDYVHRIGRTARAGRQGRAFTLATPADTRYLAGINKLINQDIPEVKLDSLSAELEPDEGRKKRRRRSDKAAGSEPAKGERRAQPPPKRGRGDRPSPEAAGKRDRPAPEAAGKRDRRKGAEDRGDEPVVGLGDHVPAFLLRPVRRRNTADSDSELV
jgi:superfamily II DNA/RNA helicase